MCGIAGLITQDPEAHIRPMLKAIEHRGRDDEGVWTSPIDAEGRRVCFGHRRLSIIDTSSAGHQPMLSHDGRLVVILNGEIYNYRELRDELAAKRSEERRVGKECRSGRSKYRRREYAKRQRIFGTIRRID